MTATITLAWQYPDGKTPITPQHGWLNVEPLDGWVDGDTLVNNRQTRHRVADGTITLTLPNETARVWKFRHSPDGTAAWIDHKLVPAGDVTVAYTDLVTIDPTTLEPAPAELANAIEAVTANTLTSGEIVGGDLILTRGDGTTVNAGVVATSSDAVINITDNGDGTLTLTGTSITYHNGTILIGD